MVRFLSPSGALPGQECFDLLTRFVLRKVGLYSLPVYFIAIIADMVQRR